MTIGFDPLDLVLAERYGARGHPHEVWTRLRASDPVAWCEPEGYRPFWAVTKHGDIKWISGHPELFSSAERSYLLAERIEQRARRHLDELLPGAAAPKAVLPRNLLNMDPPEHRAYRNLAGPYFRPQVLRELEERVREITRLLLDRYRGDAVELDFVSDFAQWHPLCMICEMLGVAPADEGVILRLTNELFGGADAEFSGDSDVFTELFGYFRRLIDAKRTNPGEDLASVLSNATIDGELVPHAELLTYFTVLATAGHDTTRTSLAGGLHALITHPEQLERLRRDHSLGETAADEIARWTSPIVHFMRTATDDVELRGKTIRGGQSVALFYPSGNRDEEVFDAPFEFRVDRDPNPHVAFGHGEHFCLGASLARMEIRVLLEELVPRLAKVELAAEPQRLSATLVSGFKHLPVRWWLE